ncbi:structural maintenance of chromosomes flexible hinge domain-containing protein GMI1 isoform X2 [Macadamia integrifolia]|uniref:structural maintenance of chromosomes flexible hinge domain-containing protein GMI1 isoform X2 n=1 Tax=Macadamia integrifolia TaxID=60698 RepID=UPI001C4FDC46|nr:structural maintenance of chromosomes flexible hinge domain-containing protein GMI1 isoform X2 [Macadamia integrifolia]
MALVRSTKRPIVELDDEMEKVYKFRVLLPNGTSVGLTFHEPGDEIMMNEFMENIKREYFRTINAAERVKVKRKVLWKSNDIHVEDVSGIKFRKRIPFKHFKPYKCHFIRLYDGTNEIADTFENMWDLTPDTDLLKELPEEYTFETALADLIDNSLQAVWSNKSTERRLVSVTIDEQKIMIFDTGPGMDGSDENSIVKWGKMGASLHRSSREQAIGGKPPYLTPFFGMFGYGGPIASMHLGRSALVSSKTKDSKKVYTLRLERDALLRRSDQTWQTGGGLRSPLEDELRESPQSSFTKVEIFEPKIRSLDAFKLQCRLKDIYFPYIQVNGDDLAEIEGGEVAITNLHSCNGPEFVIQLRFSISQANTASSRGSRALREANARLRCVYFPIVEGEENINRILEKLDRGYGIAENFDTFCRVSVRRLGRLLPDARWGRLPFMEPKLKKGDKAQLLKRCCMRVKCIVETDAGFNPTPSKTDLAHHHPYTTTLKNFGNRHPEKDNDTHVDIYRGGKPLSLSQLEKEYQDWVFQMHDGYDEEMDCGEDEPVLVVNPCNKKALGISSDVVRVHKVIRRKGASWRSGQKVKILKGAAAGCHKNNIYATLEYILVEGFQGDVGGSARLICRPLDLPDDKGSLLSVSDGNASLDIHGSLSIPISVIDLGKFEAINDTEWNFHLEKQRQKAPSTIDILNAQHCQQLELNGALPLDAPVCAGHDPPREIVAVVRPVDFSSSSASRTLDQKYILKVDQEMYMEVKFSGEGKDCVDGEHIYGERVKPSSRNGFHGLYIFSLERKITWLFERAGIYTFSFSANFPVFAVKRCEKKVIVKPSSNVGKWRHVNGEKFRSRDLSVGSCLPPISIACFDVYGNRVAFTCIPEVLVKLDMKGRSPIHVDKVKVELSSNKMTFKVKDMMIESGDIDKIRPDYKATLVICSQDELFSVHVPCQVAPGPLCHIKLQSSNLGRCLLPGIVIEKIKLEMLDALGNHVKKGLEVHVNVDGFCFLDRAGPRRKVDDEGCVDLSGLLKVSGGYGKNVSLSVHLDERLIFKEEFHVEKRELRTISTVPEYCRAGYKLKDIVFEVVNAKGAIDEAIHDEVKCGQSHTLMIKSESLGIDDPTNYTFKHGRCTIPVIEVPSGQNVFHFEVAHAHHPELHMNFKIHVLQDPKAEPNEVVETHDLDGRFPLLSDSSHSVPKDIDFLVKSIINDEKDLENDIFRIGLRVGNHEDKLKSLFDRKEAIEQDIYDIQNAIIEPQLSSQLDCLVNGKEFISKQIARKGDTAAAVICNLSKTNQLQESQPYLKQDIIGIVALLGIVNDITVSRIFAEHLGEDHMLAVVCKSHAVASALEKYENDGKVDRRHALHAAARELGISINRRFLVICLEDIRPYTGKFEGKNPQRKLALPDPLLPTGEIPRGFLGYAVNMINPDIHYLHIRTTAGHGLRETLFYLLFGELQVFETRADMQRAYSCIKHGAISLDGGIMKRNGIISLGYREPEVCFPVIMPEVPMDFARDTIEILSQIEDKKLELLSTNDEITKENRAYCKSVKKFQKKKEWYKKLMDYKEPLVRGSLLEYKSNINE